MWEDKTVQREVLKAENRLKRAQILFRKRNELNYMALHNRMRIYSRHVLRFEARLREIQSHCPHSYAHKGKCQICLAVNIVSQL